MSAAKSHTFIQFVSKMASRLAVVGALAMGFAPGLSFAAPAKDDGHGHSEEVCSKKDATVCAHLGLPETLDTKGAKKFIVDIITGKNGKDKSGAKVEIKNLKVKLWMPDMNHGSLPVKIAPEDDHHFLVTEVRFSMPGLWQVRLDFDIAKSSHHIEIPVEIKE